MDWKGAVEDIQGAVDYLHSKGCTKVGVTGFCKRSFFFLLVHSLNKITEKCVFKAWVELSPWQQAF